MARSFTIKVPASSANIGPGYDVLGISLSLYLELHVVVDPDLKSDNSCILSYTEDSEGYNFVPLEPTENLITRAALYTLRCNGVKDFPQTTKVVVRNPIPLGRGLGSSGAATVAGVLLGNEIGNLGLSREQCLDYSLMVERHPDNITASMMGGFRASFLRSMSPEELDSCDTAVEKVIQHYSSTKGEQPTGTSLSFCPPSNMSMNVEYNWNSRIKCISVIPSFHLSTEDARRVLPREYSTSDVVFNLQRLAVLTNALGQDPPRADLIYPAMQDKIHQPYRKALVPGLADIIELITPTRFPGLLGICLSGAGPSILALATDNFESIAQEIIKCFAQNGVESTWKLSELCQSGPIIEDA